MSVHVFSLLVHFIIEDRADFLVVMAVVRTMGGVVYRASDIEIEVIRPLSKNCR